MLDRISTVAKKLGRTVYTWTITQGLKTTNEDVDEVDLEDTQDLIGAFEYMLQYIERGEEEDPTLFVMLDLHPYIQQDPVAIRFVRDVANRLETSRHSLILVSPSIDIPSDLEKTIAMIDWPLPDEDELNRVLAQCEKDLPPTFKVLINGNRQKITQAMLGLTIFEASSVLLSALAATRELSEKVIPFIIAEKRQIIRKSGALEFYEADVKMSQVGGLPNVKEYAKIKRRTFSTEAREFGVEPAKGMILVGIPGTGKSLVSKAVAGGEMPLLRLDVGALFGSLVGESEANTRNDLKIAEAIAPCVLWVDEIEKALAGMSGSGDNDGGTTKRVFGTILTWMQETTAPVYIIATANDVRSLRPELIRRFDDVFFVDLPNQADRSMIFEIHLSKRGRDPADFDLEALALETWGYTGAEIEKVVKSALERAFHDEKNMTNSTLLDAAGEIIPILEKSPAKSRSKKSRTQASEL
jgi:ATP-dependent 26S proteasome regulatory subunit